ncbi:MULTISPECIES: hypothetical protein [unclassified Pseudomonas]|uniref:hypothetical protein n=1 Tax=unclassified Pseudomonas TaxID=196821 RepID=UPI002114671C|nr:MULTISPECIES: hypothetical protein [unclassified Pseudomonas]
MTLQAISPARYEDGRTLNLAGFAERFSMSDLSGLPLLWQRFAPHLGHVPGQLDHDSYGVCYNPDAQGGFDATRPGSILPMPVRSWRSGFPCCANNSSSLSISATTVRP